MTWQRVGLYYLFAIVLGGYYLLFEWRPGGPEAPIFEPRPVREGTFLTLKRGTIHKLSIHRQEHTFVSQRNEAQPGEIQAEWRTLEPSGAPVTSALVISFLENLTPDRKVPIVHEAPEDLASYGLAPPASTVIVEGDGEQGKETVFIGGYNPTKTAVYARKDGSPEVLLLGYNVKYYEDLIFQATRRDTEERS